MTKPRCTLCRAEDGVIIAAALRSPYSTRTYSLRECSVCGHLQTEPYPSAAELREIYRTVYSYNAHSRIRGEKRRRARRLFRWLQTCGVDISGKTLLDLGAMFGDLIAVAEQLGARAHGVELESYAARIGVSEGRSITTGSLEDFLAVTTHRADVVVCSHVIEHVREPMELLERLKKVMSPDSYLVLSVPNRRSRLARLLGSSWAWWQMPVHLNHFDARSISALLRGSGFEPGPTRYACGDSLMFELSTLNLIGRTPNLSSGQELGALQHIGLSVGSALVSAFTPLLSLVFDDELTMLARLAVSSPREPK